MQFLVKRHCKALQQQTTLNAVVHCSVCTVYVSAVKGYLNSYKMWQQFYSCKAMQQLAV